jgi:NAD(P)-dependent dehydrogenase (short-subunit alcohol dehydrogenase family)
MPPMELEGRHVIVTGGAGGIGSALARRFHAAGARVVVADLDGAGAARVATELEAVRGDSAVGVGADVGTADGNAQLIDAARRAFGEIDLFFANAGVGVGGELDTNDDDWQLAFHVNIEAHVFAARLLVPGWIERGDGYFCSTASAAGLLTQIGSAPYSVTKHAAVAFAEWLSITYGDRGLKVSCLCPMGVNTNMLNAGDALGAGGASSVVRAAGEVLEPDEVAEVVAQAIGDERFLILPHPEVLTFFQRKASDYDRWLAGMRRLRARAGG